MNHLVVYSRLAAHGVKRMLTDVVPVCDDHYNPKTSLHVGMTQDTCIHCSMEWSERWQELLRLNTWLGEIQPDDVIYIGGPMETKKDHNHREFELMEHALKLRGAVVLSPIHHDDPKEPYEAKLKAAYKLLLDAHKMVLLRDWEGSFGATREQLLAESIKIKIYYEI